MGSRPRESDGDPAAAAWLADPFARHEQRWWDGTEWTGRVSDGGRIGIDPPVIDPRPEGAPLDQPAAPIEDAIEPIKGPDDRTLIGLVLGAIVIAGLIVLVAIVVLG
ncbi:MAG: DUF2510 domain-containing protein [Acidimicrobiia bacterium]|nr:DUF2510 domain-containing protein [Acidimicrobiia bacterium]